MEKRLFKIKISFNRSLSAHYYPGEYVIIEPMGSNLSSSLETDDTTGLYTPEAEKFFIDLDKLIGEVPIKHFNGTGEILLETVKEYMKEEDIESVETFLVKNDIDTENLSITFDHS